MSEDKIKDGDKQRTKQQNRALHLYFRFVAEALNDSGLDMRTVLKPGVEIEWTEKTVKEYLWRPIQKIQLMKESTTELTRKELDTVYDTMNLHLSRHGEHVPFPCGRNNASHRRW